jgi:predicted ArsR family transcriptional regulator
MADEIKKVPGTVKLAEMLQEGPATVAELAEACGISENTVKVQLSFHLKQKGYVIEKTEDGKFQITGKGEPLPPKPKKAKKAEAAEGTESGE